MSRRQSEKEQFWRWVLVEFEKSGLAVRTFCHQEGIAEPSFYAWRKKIAQLDQSSPQAQPSLIQGSSQTQPRLVQGYPQTQPSLIPVRVRVSTSTTNVNSTSPANLESASAGNLKSSSTDMVGSAALSDNATEPVEVAEHRVALPSLPVTQPAWPTTDSMAWPPIEVATPSGWIVRIGQACGLDWMERTLLAIDASSQHHVRHVRETQVC